MYYRLAMHQRRDPLDGEGSWQWTSTVLSSLQSLIQVLRLYRSLPQERLRVFSSHTPEGLQEQLVQENSTGDSAPRTRRNRGRGRAGAQGNSLHRRLYHDPVTRVRHNRPRAW